VSGDLSKGPQTNAGNAGAISSFAIARSDSRVIYAGTNDGNLWVTDTGGEPWRKVSDGLPNRWVSRVTVDPADADTAYVAFSGYYELDTQPYLLVTHDRGVSWRSISGNLPRAPVNDVLVDPLERDTLYAA